MSEVPVDDVRNALGSNYTVESFDTELVIKSGDWVIASTPASCDRVDVELRVSVPPGATEAEISGAEASLSSVFQREGAAWLEDGWTLEDETNRGEYFVQRAPDQPGVCFSKIATRSVGSLEDLVSAVRFADDHDTNFSAT